MKHLRLILSAGVVASSLVLAGCPRKTVESGTRQPATSPANAVDSTQYTTGLFENCPPEGSGGDAALNRLKNRDVPPPSYEPMTIPQIVTTRPVYESDMDQRDRSRWPRGAREEVSHWENRGVVVEGYLLKVKQMEPESCNCKEKRRRDYHLWLGTGPGEDRSQSIIAEVSPRLLPAHDNWRLRILARLAQNKARVRLSGWMMWDQEHPEQIGKTRGTLWEIHPIHVIEVYSGGRWRNLDG